MSAPTVPLRKCPTCGKQAVLAHRPFCSKRCANLDFGRWLGGAYVIPAKPGEEDEDENEDGEAGNDPPASTGDTDQET